MKWTGKMFFGMLLVIFVVIPAFITVFSSAVYGTPISAPVAP